MEINKTYYALNDQKLRASLSYVFDSTIGTSGAYRPITPGDFGDISLGSLSVSGVDRVGVTGGYIGITGTYNVAVTGGKISVDNIAVTGNVQVNNVAITGNVTISPNRGGFINASSSISASGISQQVVVGNSSRNYILFQNISPNEMYINFDSVATINSDSFYIAESGGFAEWSIPSYVPTGALNVISNYSGHKFVCKHA